MEQFAAFLNKIDEPDHRERTEEILSWVLHTFPQLDAQIKWNVPMFTDHGTFIIAFDKAKQHLSVSPEEKTMARFADDIATAGYSSTKGLFRIPWKKNVNYELLQKLIEFNINDKKECRTFWRA